MGKAFRRLHETALSKAQLLSACLLVERERPWPNYALRNEVPIMSTVFFPKINQKNDHIE